MCDLLGSEYSMGSAKVGRPRSSFRRATFLSHPLLVALAAALVTGVFTLAAAAIGSRNGSTLGGVLAPAPTVVTTVTAYATVAPTATVTTTPIMGPEPTGSQDTRPNPLLLADIASDHFVKRSFGARPGVVTIDGVDYANAYSYTFSNCTSCTYVDVIKIHRAYTRLTGSFGLTDDSRHDDVIDGVVYASIYANDKLLYGPKRVEYPARIQFDLKMDASRITLKVADGTNAERAAWANVRLHY